MEATSPASASTLPLPDDVLLYILALVSADNEAALFRCATTCRRWRGLIADPAFLRRCWPENAACSLVGFFTQQSRLGYVSTYRGTCTIVHAFVPGPRSPHSSPVTRILSTFVPAADALLEHATPLTSRGGLILMRAVDGPNFSTLRLSVCNPLARTAGTGTCDSLPPLERFRVLYYALVTAADFPSKPGSYRVIAIGFTSGDIKKYTILTFSSGDSSWSSPEIVDPPSGVCGGMWALQGQGPAVVAQGTAHWLLRDASSFYTLNVSAVTGQHSLKKISSISPSQLPKGTYKYDAPRLTVTSNGTLQLVCMDICKYGEDVHVLTWTRQPGDAEEWIPTRRIKLTKPCEYLRCLCTTERGGTLLISGGINDRLYIASLEAAQVLEITDDGHFRYTPAKDEEVTDEDVTDEEVTDEEVTDDDSDLRYTSAEPFEVDWPTFFMSRIGVQ